MRNYLLLLAFLPFIACQPNVNESSSDSNILSADSTEKVLVEQSSLNDSTPFDSSQYSFVDDAILLDWRMLSKVKFNSVYNEDVQNYIPYPEFDSTLIAIDGQKVIIQGYIIPVEETGEQSILVLSANPFSSCFFCGGAGPETVMDVKLTDPLRLETDEVVQFKGKFRLNDSDLYYLNYILESAERI
ncbi:MAG: hypothetical protein MK226_00820 [Saprospiraceae bacterium]|nr:hypothetical protein [Saprospiraceae bacterium]